MGFCRLGLIVFAALCFLLALKADPAAAQSAKARADLEAAAAAAIAPLGQRVIHRRRAKSFYCYPKNYWWFYRPYTTAQENYPRCMPYFHYLDEPASRRRGATKDRLIK